MKGHCFPTVDTNQHRSFRFRKVSVAKKKDMGKNRPLHGSRSYGVLLATGRVLAEQPPGPVKANQHLNGKGSEAEGDCRWARRNEMDNRLRDAGAKKPKRQWVGHRCS